MAPARVSVRRATRGSAAVSDDEQDIFDLFLLEEGGHRFLVRKRKLPYAGGGSADHAGPASGIAAASADDPLDRHGATAHRSCRVAVGEAQMGHRYLVGHAVGTGEVQRDLLDPELVDVRWEVIARGGETHDHRCAAQLGVVEVVPLIAEFVAEAERAVGAERAVDRRQHALPMVTAVQGGVFDGEQDIRDGAVVEPVGRSRHTQFPGGLDTDALEGIA